MRMKFVNSLLHKGSFKQLRKQYLHLFNKKAIDNTPHGT